MTALELGILTFFNALNYLGRYLFAAVKPAFGSELGFSYETTGWLLSGWALGYVVASPLFGALGYRLSRPKVLTVAIVVWSSALVLFGMVSSFAALFGLRIVLGIAQAGFSTLVPGYLSDRITDPIRITRALSLLFCAIPLGTALAYGIGALLANEYGWRMVFSIFGLPGILLGFVLWRWPEARNQSAETNLPLATGLRQITAVPALRYALGGYILNSFGMNGIAGFIQDYGVSLGFGLQEIGGCFLLILIAGSVGTVIGGAVCSRWERRSAKHPFQILFWFIGGSGLLALPALLAAFLVTGKGAFIVLCGVGVWFVFVGTGPLNALLVRSSPPGLVNLVQGLTIVLLNLLGSFAAPPLVGRLADTVSLQAGMLLCVGALALSAVVWLIGGSRSTHE